MSEILANVVVSMPSQLFTMPRAFKAVANGKIYIGQIDTDPVNPANQIQVYIENEDGSLVPIAQPIVINAAGYPVYNGQIAKFVTAQGHSMAVYDSYGAQQFYFPNVLKYDPDQFSVQLKNGDGSLVGVYPQGNLKNALVSVSADQFGAVGDGVTDNASSIQDAINWVHDNGGGKVFLGNGEYMSGPLTLKSRVIIEGQSYQTTKLKAISGWNSQSFIISDGFNDYSTASPIPPGCFSAGLRNICINGNKSGFGGSPSKLSGNGVMIAGSNTVMENVMIIYVPSVGLVTQDYGQNDQRAGYMAANPDMGWMIIPTLRNIRIQFCGNDCWHCESQDAFIDDVEIVGAGYGSTPSADLRSFWAPTQRVADFRVWRAVTLGFIHCYGNYNGYGIVAGRGNSTSFMRFQYEQIIVESCMVNLWMMRDAVPSGGRIDSHQGTGDASIPIHGSFVRVPINIIDVNNSDISDLGSIYINQKDPAHNGIYLILNGQNYSVQNINITRSPLVSDALSGTGVYLNGSNIRIESGILKGFFGTNSESVPSSGFVAASGSGNYINMTCSFSNYGFRSHAADVLTGGRIECIGVSNPFYGFENYAVRNRSRIMMKNGNSGNTISGITSVINSGITTVQTIEATGLTLPYTPLPEEVSATLAITAFSGSSIIPTSYVIIYDQGASTVNKLVFRIQLQNSTSPMQAVIRWKLN